MEHFMTSEEIAELLHVDPVTIRRLVNKGELSAYRIGADYRFAPSDLQVYLQRQRIAAHAPNESGTSSSNPLDQLAQLLRKTIQGKHTTPSDLVGSFELFTKRARHVMTLAQEEARHFQHNYIGTEHLLLGLLREGEGVAAQVLSNLGIDVETTHEEATTIEVVRRAYDVHRKRVDEQLGGKKLLRTPPEGEEVPWLSSKLAAVAKSIARQLYFITSFDQMWYVPTWSDTWRATWRRIWPIRPFFRKKPTLQGFPVISRSDTQPP